LSAAQTAEQEAAEAAQRGFEFLVNKTYLPTEFDQETFDQVWQAWPPALKARAEKATPEERRRMAFLRYGLTTRPGDESGKPLQYVVDDAGNWAMNCFACHGGSVGGKPYPGRPNSNIGLQSLTADMRLTKLIIKKRLSPMDAGSILYPLGTNRGLTNSVMFGVTLMAYRNPDLTMRKVPREPELVHHDMDAPPWWNFKHRKMLYIDAFATKSARSLMPFLLVPENTTKHFERWENEYEDVYAYLSSIQPPKYPYAIDAARANHGRQVFNDHCAECHGTYGPNPEFPERVIDIADIGTDRTRLDALDEESRIAYADSWFTHFRQHNTVIHPTGYVAPPLHGIWASAPYLHNGAVPTLWHMLHPEERPKIWRRVRNEPLAVAEYDQERAGLAVTQLKKVPVFISKHERREIFDTSKLGKSAAGHDYPSALAEDEKQAVLEYLKTL
jgi:mono/diheme cytochrome c family protein